MFVVDENKCTSTLVHTYNGLFESVFITVNKLGSKFLLILVYMPPGSDALEYTSLSIQINEITDKYPQHKPIIMGDFNLPYINWIENLSEISIDTSN